ncbi:alpha/beta hydrolase [Streptomyces longwoodensis]|uniref:alpha/beta hydrolase n=1 Tax=Streptomyces longwoodensis TaxID=68231 RepID=UPI0033FD363B
MNAHQRARATKPLSAVLRTRGGGAPVRGQDRTPLQDTWPQAGARIPLAARDSGVEVRAGRVHLTARLSLTDSDRAVAVLASGGRSSLDDRYFARVLHQAGFGTLVTDLLAADEVGCPHDVFDVPLLAGRLRGAATWLYGRTGLPYAYVAADTAAAAAVEATAPGLFAIVSRGGRPDLASPAALAAVRVPTLIVVGSLDTRVLGRTRVAVDWMCCEHRIVLVPGAPHLLTGPPELAAVADLAREWLSARLPRTVREERPSPVRPPSPGSVLPQA